MTDDQLFADIAAQRRALVARLTPLAVSTPALFDRPSLCSGWRAHDVVAHLVSILELPLSGFLRSMVRHGVNGGVDQIAREVAQRPVTELLSTYERLADSRFKPPGGGAIAPLSDVVIHTRDIERPLGLASELRDEDVRRVLSFLVSGKARGFVPGKRVRGLQFIATDMEWQGGSGAVVSGPAEALMMAVAGRGEALRQLGGTGVPELTERVTSAGSSRRKRNPPRV